MAERYSLRQTTLSPDHMSEIAHTLTSTSLVARTVPRTTSPVRSVSTDRPIATIGVALDASAHPGRTARNHLRTMCAASGLPKARADEVLDEVGIASVAEQRVGGFSLGMRQRLALAGALLGEPETLLLDEPANGLDPDGIRWLRSYLRGYADSGGAVFVSSHLIAELSLFADDLVVIGAGRLLAAATVDEITNSADTSVLVQTPQRSELTVLLAERGLSVSDFDSCRLNVTGMSRADIAQLALDHHIRLDELVDQQSSLEDLLVDLTSE